MWNWQRLQQTSRQLRGIFNLLTDVAPHHKVSYRSPHPGPPHARKQGSTHLASSKMAPKRSTGCCKTNAIMLKRHCTHTTRNKQKTIGTLQFCAHVVFYVAATHRFTAALICCTTLLACQNLLFPPTLLHPNSHSPVPLQPKRCNCKEPSRYLPCSLVSTPH